MVVLLKLIIIKLIIILIICYMPACNVRLINRSLEPSITYIRARFERSKLTGCVLEGWFLEEIGFVQEPDVIIRWRRRVSTRYAHIYGAQQDRCHFSHNYIDNYERCFLHGLSYDVEIYLADRTYVMPPRTSNE